MLTVGHGTLPGEAFVGLLENAGVRLVVDVRRNPGSRRHPQHGRVQLSAALDEAGIRYRWEEALGGRRSVSAGSPNVALRNAAFRGYADHMTSDAFRMALRSVLGAGDRDGTAILCAESLWWRCHRRLIADAAVLLHRVAVEHLGHDGRLTPHVVTDGARTVGDELVYDGGRPPALL